MIASGLAGVKNYFTLTPGVRVIGHQDIGVEFAFRFTERFA
jgi:hypothetical protein